MSTRCCYNFAAHAAAWRNARFAYLYLGVREILHGRQKRTAHYQLYLWHHGGRCVRTDGAKRLPEWTRHLTTGRYTGLALYLRQGYTVDYRFRGQLDDGSPIEEIGLSKKLATSNIC